jgi:hypothetical protein
MLQGLLSLIIIVCKAHLKIKTGKTPFLKRWFLKVKSRAFPLVWLSAAHHLCVIKKAC